MLDAVSESLVTSRRKEKKWHKSRFESVNQSHFAVLWHAFGVSSLCMLIIPNPRRHACSLTLNLPLMPFTRNACAAPSEPFKNFDSGEPVVSLCCVCDVRA